MMSPAAFASADHRGTRRAVVHLTPQSLIPGGTIFRVSSSRQSSARSKDDGQRLDTRLPCCNQRVRVEIGREGRKTSRKVLGGAGVGAIIGRHLISSFWAIQAQISR